MAERKPFIETRAYPVVFMVLITIVFVGVLAAFQESTKARVETLRLFKDQATVLRIFSLPAGQDVYKLDPATVQAAYRKHITPVKKSDGTLDYYLCRSDRGDTLGYGYEIQGKGLWSTIRAMIAVSPDRRKLLNLEIVSEVETPGLGARIEEPWFKDQFAGKILLQDNQPVKFNLTPEGEKGTPADNRVAMITGATISSRAVTEMITAAMTEIQARGGK
jgi:Na+-transporting NADH:ubiquinone oxidoreductase subunit C